MSTFYFDSAWTFILTALRTASPECSHPGAHIDAFLGFSEAKIVILAKTSIVVNGRHQQLQFFPFAPITKVKQSMIDFL